MVVAGWGWSQGTLHDSVSTGDLCAQFARTVDGGWPTTVAREDRRR